MNSEADQLRQHAARLRQFAQYADGPAYHQDLAEAARLDNEAKALERPPVGYAFMPQRVPRTEAQRRAALVKKINTARRQLGWDDAAWEAIKWVHGQCRSIAKDADPQATLAQLEAIMNHARACGFKDSYKKANGQRSGPLSQDKQAKMLRGLWLELHSLGAVQDPDESALCRWVMTTKKGAVQVGHVTTNLAFLEWRGDDLHQAIERLKQWRLRWLKSGQFACPVCGKAFTPTDKQARAFGKIACQAHRPDVAYVFIPPVAKNGPLPQRGEGRVRG